jgi:hypothetical protein
MCRRSFRSRHWVVVLLASMFAGIAPVQHNAVAASSGRVITFEQGVDGRSVSIPDVKLTTDTGQPWIYGDIRTHKYNAPYPASCADRPGGIAKAICDYAVAGNLFVWTGFIGKEGRITFTQRHASYFEVDISTGADLTFIAYDADGNPMVSGFLGANQGTGNLDHVRLDAPTGRLIAFIRILGAANFWLLDNMRSDAIRKAVRPAEISVTHRIALADGLLRAAIIATNHGKSAAHTVRIRVPIDSKTYQLLDASFSRDGMWVSKILSNTIELETGRIGSQHDVVTATLRFQPLLPSPDPVDQRLTYTWSGDDGGGGSGQANRARFVEADGNYVLSVTPITRLDRSAYRFSGDLFVPNEPIAFWYNKPDGSVESLGTVKATSDGLAEIELISAELPHGFYSIVAYGTWSGIQAVGHVQIT